MVYAILKDGYVINRIVADAMPSDYPFPHDLIIEDVNTCIFIGDWYEESEGIFYRPIGVPVDWPDELKPPQQEQDE
jgi:hypothetical protein